MPTYVLACEADHRFEVRQAFGAALPDCTCGQPTRKLPTGFAVSGRASTPPPPSRMPQTWRGTHEGNREYLGELRRTAERRRSLEDRHPELRGDTRPILAHEGRYEAAPLRAVDAASAPAPASGHSHGPAGHHHAGHDHGPSGHTPGPAAPTAGGGGGGGGEGPTPP